MAAAVHIFGIRHHGPGSARRLVEALEALQPSVVLIEGPSDASELLKLVARPTMVPPVSLLTYVVDDPALAIFWPFAEYSPEYQAACWAVRNNAEVRFIDLPATWRLAVMRARREAMQSVIEAKAEEEAEKAATDKAGGKPGDASMPDPDAETAAAPEEQARRDLRWDPIGELARLAGYDDGESWWQDVIEENPEPGPVFAAIASAMTELRAARPTPPASPADAPSFADFHSEDEDAREAHMRLEIARTAKEAQGAVAVVCGAWHVPALAQKSVAKHDRAAIRGFPKLKVQATWAPWTSPRLAASSGYGAGVTAPGWCKHLWQSPGHQRTTAWLARVAAALRDKGRMVSTASLIEAERLAKALAAMRDKPQAGFQELREAAIASLCFGESLVWEQIAQELLIGHEVGEITDDVPLAPLVEDLRRQQKIARLKPEALERELSLDLRSESGLFRSTLLHRLLALDVDWGKLTDTGRSRGTFRERWVLRWQPEFAVKLVENLVYGSTIEMAARGRLVSRFKATKDLGELAGMVHAAMTAQLPDATAAGIQALMVRAAHTDSCVELMSALSPMAQIIRYGEARSGASEGLEQLARQITVQAAVALPYAGRNLDAQAAETFCAALKSADHAIRLIEFKGDERRTWLGALRQSLEDAQVTRVVAGTAARLLYEAEEVMPEAAADLLGRMLSPGTPVADAAGFFSGFFEGAGQRLIFDEALRNAVDAWAARLDEEDFVHNLPVFRRVLGTLDRAERRQLLDSLFGDVGRSVVRFEPASDGGAAWQRHFEIISRILTRRPADDQ